MPLLDGSAFISTLKEKNVLQHFFILAAVEDNLKQSTFIHEALNNSEVKAYFLFLKYALNYFNSFNALFQSKNVLIHQLTIESQRLFLSYVIII